MVVHDADCIFYVKKIGDGLAFHVRCFHNGKHKSSVKITLFFTTEDVSYESITKTTVGLKIPITVIARDSWLTNLYKSFIENDIFPNEFMLAAGRKILAIEEALGAESMNVIGEETHV